MIQIRPALPTDAKTLCELGIKTYCETFEADNTPEDMALYLNESFSEEIQRAEILAPDRRVKIAWDGAEAVGFFQLRTGPADSSIKGPRPIELLRLYVDARYLGKGVGSLLMRECIDTSRAEGFSTIWLGVWERNFRAQAFYRKWEFSLTGGSHIFQMGTDPQLDVFMERRI